MLVACIFPSDILIEQSLLNHWITYITGDVPSCKPTFCYGKSQFFMGKSTINGHGINSNMWMFTRGYTIIYPIKSHWITIESPFLNTMSVYQIRVKSPHNPMTFMGNLPRLILNPMGHDGLPLHATASARRGLVPPSNCSGRMAWKNAKDMVKYISCNVVQYVYTYVIIIIYIYVCMYVCMYVCICNHPEVDRIWILVGSIPTPLKNMKVSWDDEIPNIWKNKKCSKPPTSYCFPHMKELFLLRFLARLPKGCTARWWRQDQLTTKTVGYYLSPTQKFGQIQWKTNMFAYYHTYMFIYFPETWS